MDNKETQNQIMEEIAQMYEEKPWMKINDFYLHGQRGGGVCVHFSVFGQTDARLLLDLAERYGLHWVVFPHRSVDNDVCIYLYP